MERNKRRFILKIEISKLQITFCCFPVPEKPMNECSVKQFYRPLFLKNLGVRSEFTLMLLCVGKY